MDETDVALGRSLMMNSRMSFSDLGKMLDLTPQAVHRRVQMLMEEGIIASTGTYLSPRAHGRMWIVVYGWSKFHSMDELAAKFAKDRSVAILFVASGNLVYVHGMVKDVNEMGRFVSKVQKEALISDIQVGILPSPPPAPENSLSKLDLKLIQAMQHDARRPVSDVADEVGVSVKTARKRLDRMIKEELINFSMHWNLGAQPDPITNIHLLIKEDVEREKVAYMLIKRLATSVIRTYSFSNLPNHLIVTIWTRNGNEVNQICRDLEKEGLFVSVVPNNVRTVYYYDDHRISLLDDIVKERSSTEKDRPLASK